jgi:hypothetical protein
LFIPAQRITLEAQEAAVLGQQLELGSHNVSLADVRTLKDKEKVRFPMDVYRVGISLIRYAVLLQVLLQGAGPPHPYVQAMWDLATKFHQRQPFIVERYMETLRLGPYHTYPARILRYVQVQGQEYFQAIAAATVGFAAVDTVPNFTALLLHLQHGTFQNSSEWYPIPAAYLDPVPAAYHTLGNTTGGSTAASTASSAPATRISVAPYLLSQMPYLVRHLRELPTMRGSLIRRRMLSLPG